MPGIYFIVIFNDWQIIEYNQQQAQKITDSFKGTTIVINGNANDESLLISEDIERTDLFLSEIDTLQVEKKIKGKSLYSLDILQ